MRHAMLVDLEQCVACKACLSACKEQWDTGPGGARAWVHTYETGRRGVDLALAFYPGMCMQCEEHPCTAACPTGATRVDANGVVVVDGDVCIGCGSCVPACPYGARHVDREKGVAEKCNLCAPFVARGEEPACVKTCPAECRVFGDLDDPSSRIARVAAARGARPLAAPGVDVRPRNLYAGDRARGIVLSQGVVRPPQDAWLATTWRATMPVTRSAVPAVGALAVTGGLLVNLLARRDRVAREEAAGSVPPAAPLADAPPPQPRELERHPAGLRFLHWFNAASWVVLLATGLALLSSASFALLGADLPARAAEALGGKAALLKLHVACGLAWAAVVVPLFLLFKGSVAHVLEDVRLTRDDVAWLAVKPLSLVGLWRRPLPPQDKYNAGQKAFAVFVLVATSLVVGSGLVMAFHLGPAGLVSAAILVHGVTVAAAVLGLAVHLTMAAVIAEERPALRSMVTGRIDLEHARHHSPKWVARVGGAAPSPADGRGTKEE